MIRRLGGVVVLVTMVAVLVVALLPDVASAGTVVPAGGAGGGCAATYTGAPPTYSASWVVADGAATVNLHCTGVPSGYKYIRFNVTWGVPSWGGTGCTATSGPVPVGGTGSCVTAVTFEMVVCYAVGGGGGGSVPGSFTVNLPIASSGAPDFNCNSSTSVGDGLFGSTYGYASAAAYGQPLVDPTGQTAYCWDPYTSTTSLVYFGGTCTGSYVEQRFGGAYGAPTGGGGFVLLSVLVYPTQKFDFSTALPAPVSDCELESVTGNTNDPTADGTTVYNYTVDWAGNAQVIVANDVGAETAEIIAGTPPLITVPGAAGESFASDATVDDGGSEIGGFPVPGFLTTPAHFALTFLNGSGMDPDFWCYSASTGWVDWGEVTNDVAQGYQYIGENPTGTNLPPGTSPQSDYCSFSQWESSVDVSGWGYLNPVTWVEGGLEMLKGLLECLFIPDSTEVAKVENVFGANASTCSSGGAVGVSQYFGCMSSMVLATPSADVATMKASADGTACSGLPSGANPTYHILSVGPASSGHTVSASGTLCTLLASGITYSGDNATFLTWLNLLLSAAFYVLSILLAYHLLRRIITGSY